MPLTAMYVVYAKISLKVASWFLEINKTKCLEEYKSWRVMLLTIVNSEFLPRHLWARGQQRDHHPPCASKDCSTEVTLSGRWWLKELTALKLTSLQYLDVFLNIITGYFVFKYWANYAYMCIARVTLAINRVTKNNYCTFSGKSYLSTLKNWLMLVKLLNF